MSTSMQAVEDRLTQRYDAGFVTDIATEVMPPGLDEDVIRAISAKKDEPEWLTEWRLAAYRRWLAMTPPDWAKLSIEPIDYQSISYFAAPKGPKYQSLDEVPKELLDTYDRLGVPCTSAPSWPASPSTRCSTPCRWAPPSAPSWRRPV